MFGFQHDMQKLKDVHGVVFVFVGSKSFEILKLVKFASFYDFCKKFWKSSQVSLSSKLSLNGEGTEEGWVEDQTGWRCVKSPLVVIVKT